LDSAAYLTREEGEKDGLMENGVLIGRAYNIEDQLEIGQENQEFKAPPNSVPFGMDVSGNLFYAGIVGGVCIVYYYGHEECENVGWFAFTPCT
jgi:hypothetical protein